MPDEAFRVYKFQRGLKPEFKPFMASHERGIVEVVHEAALRLERGATDSRMQATIGQNGMLMTVQERDSSTSNPQLPRQYFCCTPRISLFGADDVGFVSIGSTSAA